MTILASSVQYSNESTFHFAIRQEDFKGIHTVKEEIKCSLLADNMISILKNPKDSTQKLLEIVHVYSKVAAYKNPWLF